MMEWEQIASTALGGSIAAAVAKYFIGNTMKLIEAMPEKLSEIKTELSTMRVKLEILERLHPLVQEHDRKIVMLEAQSVSRKPETSCTDRVRPAKN